MIGINDATIGVGGKTSIPTLERLNRFCPQAFACAGKADVTVLNLLMQRNGKDHGKAPDKVLMLIAVEYKCVNHAQGFLAGMEIHPNGKGQPDSARG